jgi:hypothetical protein
LLLDWEAAICTRWRSISLIATHEGTSKTRNIDTLPPWRRQPPEQRRSLDRSLHPSTSAERALTPHHTTPHIIPRYAHSASRHGPSGDATFHEPRKLNHVPQSRSSSSPVQQKELNLLSWDTQTLEPILCSREGGTTLITFSGAITVRTRVEATSPR